MRRILLFAGTLALCAALITTLFFATISRAEPGSNQVVGFQGRLLDSNGENVPDGYYNMQFKIYQGGTGTAAGNPGGTLKWTETYINNGNAKGAVEVNDGYLSVNLGSITPFGNSIDWNQGTLWLSMNVAGSARTCTTFGAGPCVDDGEMLPMKRLTAVPYALNAGAIDGKTADNFIQLAQGVQTDASTNTSSIFLNKTGTGNLIQLQNTASDVFTVTNTGDLTFGSSSDHTISLGTAAANTVGHGLTVVAGAGGSGSGSAGGTLSLQGGSAGGDNGNGGDIQIDAGAGTGTGNGGAIAIGTANASSITIGAGELGLDGTTTIQAKNAVTIKADGATQATFSGSANAVYFGNGVTASAPNDYTLQGTNSSAATVAGGSLTVQGGDATVGDANGGNVTLAGGAGSGTGANGLVVLSTPTFSTVINDANCYTDGAVVAASCTVAASSVNNSAAVLVGFSNTNQTATLPDPTIKTAGRIIYVTAASDSKDFILSINGGGDGNEVAMRKNVTTSLLWNGSDWTVASGASSSALSHTNDGTKVQIGDGADGGSPTVLTLDKGTAAPTATDNDALLGSMYYDTTLGKLQCYEATGWGACGSSPDIFVTISPEYTGAVTRGAGIGSITSDLCSDSLDINDGTSAQPTICGTNETYNFYDWTSPEATAQTKEIYVTYKLPSTFKEFASGLTSLMGRTDGPDSAVTYQVYRNSAAGLSPCGLTASVSTGAKTSWQTETATGLGDPSVCGFEAGDSIVFKISLSAANDAHAYVGNLGFTYSNQ